jgi:hypothetical protein
MALVELEVRNARVSLTKQATFKFATMLLIPVTTEMEHLSWEHPIFQAFQSDNGSFKKGNTRNDNLNVLPNLYAEVLLMYAEAQNEWKS